MLCTEHPLDMDYIKQLSLRYPSIPSHLNKLLSSFNRPLFTQCSGMQRLFSVQTFDITWMVCIILHQHSLMSQQ
uniref:Uncharacterized protein n=1 Tax=Arundo donax TaxID=35708 RepID=A0A0A9GQ17_ARUDO